MERLKIRIAAMMTSAAVALSFFGGAVGVLASDDFSQTDMSLAENEYAYEESVDRDALTEDSTMEDIDALTEDAIQEDIGAAMEENTEDVDGQTGILIDESVAEAEIETPDIIEEESVEEQVVGVANNHVHEYSTYEKKVKHAATGHYETVRTTARTMDHDVIRNLILSGKMTSEEANAGKVFETHVVCSCGEWLDADENGNYISNEKRDWNIAYHASQLGHWYESDRIFLGYTYPVEEKKWVEDKPAWTETVTAYRCNGCGETHDKKPADIGKGTLTTAHAEYEYTGSARQPKPSIRLNGKLLTNGTDYVVGYTGNKNLGTATLTAYGRGNYQGKVTCTFKIVQADISKGTMATKSESYVYNGKAKKPTPTLKVGSKTLIKDQDYTLTYKKNTNIGLATVTAKGIGNYSGTKSCNFRIVSEQKEIIPVYRLFNTRTGEHFYTASTSERQKYLNAGNWNSEGIAWYAPKTSSEPIYRLSNPNNGNEHHYTKSKSEKDWLVGLGWHYDCIAWYSDTDKIVPIYRHYHPIQRTGNHHYTTSKGESDHIVKYEGWRYEGISFYVSKAGG